MTDSQRLLEARSYASDVGVLGVLRALSRLRGLILLPIIARGLGAGVYGAWTQSLVVVSLGSSIIDMQLKTAVVRFVSGTSNRSEQRSIFLTALIVIVALGVAAAGFTYAVPGAMAASLLGDIKYLPVARLLGTWIGLTAVSQLCLQLLRGLQKVKLYGLLTTMQVLLQLVVVAITILFSSSLLLAVRAAIGLEVLFAALMLIIVFRNLGFGRPQLSYLKKSFGFSLPLVPSYYGAVVLSFADRLYIAAQLGAEAVGIYAAAYSLAQIVSEIFTPIRTALLPAASRSWDRGDHQTSRWLLSKTTHYYLLLAIPALVGLSLLGPEILRMLSTELIAQNVRILIPLLGLGLLLKSLQSIFLIMLQLIEETRLMAVARFFSAPFYVLLVVLMVPWLGLLGGALASLAGYAFDLALTSLLTWRRQRFELPVRPVIKAIVAALSMMGPMLLLDLEGAAGVILGVGMGLLLYFGVMILLRGIVAEELGFVNSMIRSQINGQGK